MWEAETKNGEIKKTGGDLSDSVRFSLIPQKESYLPRHDIIGIPMERRFTRIFKKIRFNDWEILPCKLLWQEGEREVIPEMDLSDRINRLDMIGKTTGIEKIWYRVISISPDKIIVDLPFKGKTKVWPSRLKKNKANEEHVHCIVCKDFRIYIKSNNGTVLITPKDYELYL